jgi:hypothetical protein
MWRFEETVMSCDMTAGIKAENNFGLMRSHPSGKQGNSELIAHLGLTVNVYSPSANQSTNR